MSCHPPRIISTAEQSEAERTREEYANQEGKRSTVTKAGSVEWNRKTDGSNSKQQIGRAIA